jgi:hypothetical protein
MKCFGAFTFAALAAFVLIGCGETKPTSDDIQQDQQETLLKEATSQTGMPAIKNFRERKILKDILELRDQNGLITYTYIENLQPAPIPGKTALGGKLTYLGETIGYGIPYATQYTNPQKVGYTSSYGVVTLPQADPNGLFSPASAEGTWVLLKDPNGKDVKPFYCEPRICVSPFKLTPD